MKWCDDKPVPVQSIARITGRGTPDASVVSHASESAPETGSFAWRDNLHGQAVHTLHNTQEGEQVCKYLRERGFEQWILDDYGLGALVIDSQTWLVIPLRDAKGTVVNLRFRSIPPAKKTYRVCPGRPLPLFGGDCLSADTSAEVLIAEGELDVLALYQYGYQTNCVSGTAGASANWKESWLDLLEPYSSFVLCYDDDEAGEAGAKKLSTKLGDYRCSRAKFPHNDANDCLMLGVKTQSIVDSIANAAPMIGVSLLRVHQFTEDLEKLITNPDDLVGRPTGSLKLDKLLGGVRPGLWVFTGETGHGKTTFATWLIREQALLGVPVMLTSFEQRPIGTVQKLLRSQMGGDFLKHTVEERREALAELGRLPIFIMDHYGEASAEKIVDTLRYARRRHGVQVALIDHLGFLTRGSGDRERQAIEEVVRTLALNAVQDGITIILICHPNRTFSAQQRRVLISDLKGASAIEQDSHVGLVIERQAIVSTRGFPAAKIYVDKVRSEFGSPGGHILLPFDPLACVYSDTWEDTPSGMSGLKPVSPC